MTRMESAVDVGTTKRLHQQFRTETLPSVPFNPEDVTVTVKDPFGAMTQVTPSAESVGDWICDVPASSSGQWRYRWSTTSPTLVIEGSFVVRRSELDHGNNQAGLPTRFPTVEFYFDDPLNAKFTFRSSTAPFDVLDVSGSLFIIKVWSSAGAVIQPELDMSDAENGIIWLRWTLDQVRLLPSTFMLSIGEGIEVADTFGDETWDEIDTAWDELGDERWGGVVELLRGTTWNEADFTWNELEDERWTESPHWGRTILIGTFVKDFDGRN